LINFPSSCPNFVRFCLVCVQISCFVVCISKVGIGRTAAGRGCPVFPLRRVRVVQWSRVHVVWKRGRVVVGTVSSVSMGIELLSLSFCSKLFTLSQAFFRRQRRQQRQRLTPLKLTNFCLNFVGVRQWSGFASPSKFRSILPCPCQNLVRFCLVYVQIYVLSFVFPRLALEGLAPADAD